VFESPWAVDQEGRETPPTPAPEINERRPHSVVPPSKAQGTWILEPASQETVATRWKEWLVSSQGDPAIVEQFRKLAATLLHGQREARLKVIMVTSAVPGEGKTLTTLNIALVLAESYKRRVLLIDADLRRPRLSEAANLTASEGLGGLLKAPEDRKASLTRFSEHLWFLPAGRPDPEPLSGLTSARMQHLLEEAAERFDWVIVDTPPVAAAADAGLLGAMVDATVFVVRAGQTPYPEVQQAIDTLGRDRIFGIVLNGVDSRTDTYSAYNTPQE
jgi:capsular exopolysaccharide synthesis family protein